jgi:hypothetical protein
MRAYECIINLPFEVGVGETNVVVHLCLEPKIKVVVISGTQTRTSGFHFLVISEVMSPRPWSTYLCPQRSCMQSQNGGVGDGLLEAGCKLCCT